MILKNIFRVFSRFSQTSSIFYTKFPGNLPQAALTALIYITKLPKENLSTSLEIFRKNLHTNRLVIPQEICKTLTAEKIDSILSFPNPLLTSYQELFNSLTHVNSYISIANNLTLTPGGISEALKTIYEFCDKGKVGFLSGDLSIELIEILISHGANIETQSLEENSELFKKIEEHLMEQEFCLPKYGIPHPLKENPQAMFIRELLIEKDSPEIVMNKIKNDMEILTHSSFGLNYLTPKEHLIKLFSSFCKRIKQEQDFCLKKELSNSRKKYASLLVMINLGQMQCR